VAVGFRTADEPIARHLSPTTQLDRAEKVAVRSHGVASFEGIKRPPHSKCNALRRAPRLELSNTGRVDSSPPESNGLPELERSWLRRQAKKLVRGRLSTRLDASDLTQDALLAATRGVNGKKFAGQGAMRAWLKVILRNLAAQHARKRSTHTVHSELSSSLPDPAVCFATGMDGSEKVSDVMHHLQHVSERNRKVVMLRVVENLSFKDVGDRLGMSEVNARVVFNRVVKELRSRSANA
jgi:RNA polymerase sigma-70 factor (ECF subfamily)